MPNCIGGQALPRHVRPPVPARPPLPFAIYDSYLSSIVFDPCQVALVLMFTQFVRHSFKKRMHHVIRCNANIFLSECLLRLAALSDLRTEWHHFQLNESCTIRASVSYSKHWPGWCITKHLHVYTWSVMHSAVETDVYADLIWFIFLSVVSLVPCRAILKLSLITFVPVTTFSGHAI